MAPFKRRKRKLLSASVCEGGLGRRAKERAGMSLFERKAEEDSL